MTGLIDMQGEPSSQARRMRRRTTRILSELEMELRRLYLRMMDEPVPARLIGVLRAGLSGGKG